MKKKLFERRAQRRQQMRSTREAWHHFYNTRVWKGLRAQRLAEEPLCRMCMESGKIVPASVVDHINPHKGDWELFIDYANTQSLCKTHHDASKQSEEHRGFSSAIGLDGWPVDPNHPANAR